MKPGETIRRLFDAILDGEVDLIASEEIFAEYRRVLFREDIVAQNKLSNEDLETAFALFRQLSIFVTPVLRIAAVKQDPTDDRFIEAAVAGQAEFIVSGDKHLLTLREYDGIQIVTPAIFVAFLTSERSFN